MCSEAGAVVNLCRPEHHAGPRQEAPGSSSAVEEVWNQTQRLMEQSEHLFRIMTHVCSQPLAGVRTCAAQYSQGCWRRCSVDDAEDDRRGLQQQQQKHSTCCEGCMGPCRTQLKARVQHQQHQQQHQHQQQQQQQQQQQPGEEESCRCRGPGPRWRRRRGGCQCGQCEDCISMDTWGGAGVPPAHQCCCPAPTTPVPPTTITSTSNPALTTTPTTTTTTTPAAACTPARRWRNGLPSPPSILTVLLLLVAALARFTEGCSSRSTPKPRPPSPTMRPNITFQTFACPPAYAAWYCLNGATCFTVKIGESILYNCECADGYMGQRCEFKDLDGSYLHTREKVLLETASIAGGATVACVLVFVVLFAVYVFMQKDKEKRSRDLDSGRDNDQQPFSGYKRPRPEIVRTIPNPYACSTDDLNSVEVQPSKPATSPGEKKEAISSPNRPGSDTPSSGPS